MERVGKGCCALAQILWPRHYHNSASRSLLLFKQAGELERVEKEINIHLQGIGLSLVNDKQHKEIAYMAVSRSAAIIILSTVGCFYLFTCSILCTCLFTYLFMWYFVQFSQLAVGTTELKWFSNPVMSLSILQPWLSVTYCLIYLL